MYRIPVLAHGRSQPSSSMVRRKSAMVLPGSSLKGASVRASASIRSSRKCRKAQRNSDQATRLQTLPGARSWALRPAARSARVDDGLLLLRDGLTGQAAHGMRALVSRVLESLQALESVLAVQGGVLLANGSARPWEASAVGSYSAGRGPFGTLDQAGNVCEWCLDTWDEAAYRKRANGEAVDPVVGKGEKELRVVRGGGWGDPAEVLQAAIRFRHDAGGRLDLLGFRRAGVSAAGQGRKFLRV